MKILIDVLNRQRKVKISSKRLAKIAKKIIRFLYQSREFSRFKIEKYQFLTISIVLIGKERMKKINSIYRGKNYNTDVLAFSYFDDKAITKEIYLGEILINPEKAKMQARQYGIHLWQEVNRLLVHGILHLFGYDHEISANHAKKMRLMEEKILKQLQS